MRLQTKEEPIFHSISAGPSERENKRGLVCLYKALDNFVFYVMVADECKITSDDILAASNDI